MDTPTPSFPLENLDPELEAFFSRRISPIFEKVAKEAPTNRMSVGGGSVVVLFNPHNYRLYFDFSGKRQISEKSSQLKISKVPVETANFLSNLILSYIISYKKSCLIN